VPLGENPNYNKRFSEAMTTSPRPLLSLIFALSLSGLSAPLLTADEPSPAIFHSKGEVRITGMRGAEYCVRVKVPLAEGTAASLDDCVRRVNNILIDTDWIDRSKAIRLKSLLKTGPHPKVKLEATQGISLLELLVIIAQEAGVNIELTEDEIVFRDGGG
jgi:hypothetical protein